MEIDTRHQINSQKRAYDLIDNERRDGRKVKLYPANNAQMLLLEAFHSS